jgi:gluconate 2-dehydrogenase gamma chain
VSEESKGRVGRASFLRLTGAGAAAVVAAAGCTTGANTSTNGGTANGAGNTGASPVPSGGDMAAMGGGQPYGYLRFFNTTEANTVVAMAERIFPASSDGPGATDLHVVDFLDRYLDGPYGWGAKIYKAGPWPQPQTSGHGWQSPAVPRDLYRYGLAAIDAYANAKYNNLFAQTTGDQQDTMLHALEKGQVNTFTSYPADAFFGLLLGDTTRGLFSDPFYGGNRNKGGWAFLGFPGDPMAYGDRYGQLIDQYDKAYTVTPEANGETGTLPADLLQTAAPAATSTP